MTSEGWAGRIAIPLMKWFSLPTTRWLVFLIGAALIVVGGYQTLQLFWENPAYPLHTDIHLYMRAGDYIVRGVNPYSAAANPGFDIYGYPPLLADVMGLLNLAIGATATTICWTLFCVASLIGAIVLMCRSFGFKLGWPWILLIIGIVSLGRVTRIDIYHGQVNVIILCALLAGLVWHSQGKTILAATCLAICMSLKPFFGILVFYFLLRREWRLAIYSLVIGAAVFFISFLPVAGHFFETFADWRTASSQLISGDSGARGDNQSMFGMFLRMFSETKFATPWLNMPVLIPAFTGLVVLACLAIAWFGFGSRKMTPQSLAPNSPAVFMLESMAVLALSLGCGPYAEGDHIFFTLAALMATVFLGLSRINEGTVYPRLWIATAVSWLALVAFLALPIKVWFTYGTADTWVGIEGWKVLLSGRNGLLLLTAGTLTAITLGLERRTALR